MFKLQRLEITGFKSFADHTEIVFTGSGITAVVGPNGCGKSNVSDAISWVLGEQKAKSLRGEDMKDVVFQGTNRRKASGMAEVVLHLVRDEESFFADEETELVEIDARLGDLDENAVAVKEFSAKNSEISNLDAQIPNGENNFDSEEYLIEKAQAAQSGSVQTVEKKIKTKRHWKPRQFALDFAPGESISVTRRLYLSGESEYQLNGKSCRLRDIQDLFAGTGLSGAHYALIEQGRIGQILSGKPSDRRGLIEEAAGISKFRTRQRAAETRLESAKTNLSRVSDIVSEIDKQAGILRRQAAKTRRYKILREEYRQSLRQTFAAEGRLLSELTEELALKLSAAEKTERAVFWQVAEQDEAARAATVEARATEENLSKLRARHSENRLERDRNAREQQYKKAQIGDLEKRFEALKAEIKGSEDRLQLAETEIKRLEKDERQERARAEQTELDLRTAENAYREKLEKLNGIETRLETERGEILRHTAAFERLTEIGRQFENTRARLNERREGLSREGIRAAEIFEDHRKTAAQLEAIAEQEREKSKKLQMEKKEILLESAAARGDLAAKEKASNELRAEFQRKKNRLETLQELETRKTIYAPAVQKLFAEQTRIGVKFSGTLADRLKVEETAEKAVENLFGTYLQAVLVESEADARRTIEYLNKNNLGRIAILVQGEQFKVQGSRFKVQGSKFKVQGSKSETSGAIVNFIGASDEFAEFLTQVFPREMAAQLKDDFDEIKSVSDQVFVSLSGDLNVGGKLFVGGKSVANEKNTSLLAFKRELRELEIIVEKLSESVGAAERETSEARAILASKENSLVDLQSRIVKVEREILSNEMQTKSIAREIERAERHQKVVGEESKQIETELAGAETKQREAAANANRANEARQTATANLTKISAELNEARGILNAENGALNEKRTLAATSGERRRAAQNALRRIGAERSELASRIARHNLEIAETRQKTEDLKSSIGDIKNRAAHAETEEIGEQNELSAMAAQLDAARAAADRTAAELAELNKKSVEARNERAELEIRQAEAVTRLKNLAEKSESELNVVLNELIAGEPAAINFNLDAARHAAEDLREKIENFGAINMLALEELTDAETRLTFLTAQRQDIIDGIAAAEAALKEIKQRSREKFRQAFHQINRYFIEFFQELFGGGRGEMTLLEAEDVLEAGIEIVAQPPGKRLQNILLLSGGEKAMTAIALVMAIFQYRPAPFCLLDEVDAPLDDANVGRFVNKIAEMSEKTQFIVITHNKRTMEAAKALYGVTMQEAGISKVVSVRFE